MIIAAVDLRVVVDNRDQLAEVIHQLESFDRAHVRGWVESYYEPGQVPRSNPNREAAAIVKAKLLEREGIGDRAEDEDAKI